MKQLIAALGVFGALSVCGTVAALYGAATVVTDGTAEGAYGAPAAVQIVGTQFGDSNLGSVDWANGSEADAAYAFVDGSYLNLVVAGNLESNYNKLEVFIDCKAGGQNRLRGDNLDVDFNGLNRMGDDGSGNGLTFDDGFEADLWLGVTCGGPTFTLYTNYAEILTDGGAGAGGYQGSTGALTPLVAASGIEFAINNSNSAGVPGGSAAADGTGVVTGVEYRIPLSVLGYTTGPIKVCVLVNGGGHDYLSNQSLGGCPAGTENFGEPRFVNFNSIVGLQYFIVPGTEVAPCPADFNDDGQVDGADLGALLGAWGSFGGPEDLSGDGLVDGADLGVLLGEWGSC